MTTESEQNTDAMSGDLPTEHVDAREVDIVELADVPAQEIILRSMVVLMSAGAEKLGLSEEDPQQSPHLDLDEARKIINALAGLIDGAAEWLGPQAAAVRDGLQGLQRAFRDSSAYPDEPGQGPGEKYTGPVY